MREYPHIMGLDSPIQRQITWRSQRKLYFLGRYYGPGWVSWSFEESLVAGKLRLWRFPRLIQLLETVAAKRGDC